MNESNNYLCGLNAITLCLNQHSNPRYLAKPKELWICDARPAQPELLQLAKKNNIPVIPKSTQKKATDNLSKDLQSYHQILWIDVTHNSNDPFNWDTAKTIAIVDHITDTQNLAAIIRSACALGIDALFYPKHAQASITPRVRFIAQGATEFLPCYPISNINQTITKAQKKGFWVYGFAETGKSNLIATEFSEKSILIIGSEDAGIRKKTLDACDFIIKIPCCDHFSCLNAASAASIIFYERQRKSLNNLQQST